MACPISYSRPEALLLRKIRVQLTDFLKRVILRRTEEYAATAVTPVHEAMIWRARGRAKPAVPCAIPYLWPAPLAPWRTRREDWGVLFSVGDGAKFRETSSSTAAEAPPPRTMLQYRSLVPLGDDRLKRKNGASRGASWHRQERGSSGRQGGSAIIGLPESPLSHKGRARSSIP